MILSQDPNTGYWTRLGETYILYNVHSPADCAHRGCAIHNHPSNHPLNAATLSWRDDRDILERICSHGMGHPDADAAKYLESIGRGYENVHGCDGCCKAHPEETLTEYERGRRDAMSAALGLIQQSAHEFELLEEWDAAHIAESIHDYVSADLVILERRRSDATMVSVDPTYLEFHCPECSEFDCYGCFCSEDSCKLCREGD